MTPEDMERAFEFLIKQQAQFAAGMQQLRDECAEEHRRLRQEHDESYRRLTDAILTVTGGVGRLEEAQEKTELRVAELTERLNAFITYVERYIAETRNGKNRN